MSRNATVSSSLEKSPLRFLSDSAHISLNISSGSPPRMKISVAVSVLSIPVVWQFLMDDENLRHKLLFFCCRSVAGSAMSCGGVGAERRDRYTRGPSLITEVVGPSFWFIIHWSGRLADSNGHFGFFRKDHHHIFTIPVFFFSLFIVRFT
jgi:hypothetical protein